MSELLTIFKQIEENFYRQFPEQGENKEYELIFSPFSTGFDYDDFLFLDATSSHEQAEKYVDELLEFSEIANTIPRQDNFWTISGDQRDYLFNPYKNILRSLRLLDTDTLKPEMLYKHPLFKKALKVIREPEQGKYKAFFELNERLTSEIEELKKSLNDENRTTVDLEIKLKEDNLKAISSKWETEGAKDKVESKILEIIKDEFKRFILDLDEVKAQLDSSKRSSANMNREFYLTSCSPNNLYKGEELEWTKVSLKKSEIQRLLKNVKTEEYQEVFGDSNLNGLEIDRIEYELLFVNVTRAWFDPNLLHKPYWDINILNREEIDIPRYTQKLIFIRNVDIQLPRESQKNRQILQKANFEHLGPFMINAGQLKQGKNIRLNSVNKALKIERKMVFNVSSKIHEQKKDNHLKTGVLINKKQQQFAHLAPQLRDRGKKNPAAQHTKPKLHTIKPMMLKANFIFFKPIKVRLQFKDTEKHTAVIPDLSSVNVLLKEKPVKATFIQEGSELVTNLNKGQTYTLEINVEGYEPVRTQLAVTPPENVKEVSKTISLQAKVEEELPESFQLIGVVTRQLGPYPNPIEQADYL
ncbi:hypothetical protein [Gramella sp. KN1008]|uniref:hypothetical protein n=1 Tax=Gramella sp. KN1008 TaxID=2529298 RepID=UPI0010400105|nr:hypothetical protein [Gramella sp. KN1008]TBW28679.1 hypothetical protein EZJ28_08070 [Gramella sp. KN1008]